MPSDLPFVFVSHVSEDRAAATDVVRALEHRGVRCWIAPRDIHPGRPYDDEIADAIENCSAMLLIFSERCNESEYIRREITVAGESRKLIVPFRIENAQPRKGLRVRLADLHWVDAFASRERGIDELVRTFRPDEKPTVAPAFAAAPSGVADRAETPKMASRPAPSARSLWWPGIAIAVLVLGGASVAGFLMLTPRQTGTPPSGASIVTPVETKTADASGSAQPNKSAEESLAGGRTFLAKNDYDRAIAELDQAIKLEPRNAEALYTRGLAYYNKASHDRAIADFNAALLIRPRDDNALYYRGLSYFAQSAYERAMADFSAAIEINPRATAYFMRGLVQYYRSDDDKAIGDYDVAIRYDPNWAVAFESRGDSYRRKGDVTRAVADYKEAIRLDPSKASKLNQRISETVGAPKQNKSK